MEPEELIDVGDYVYHQKYGYGKVVFFDGTNIVNFKERQQSCLDRELQKISVSSLSDEQIKELNH